MIRTRMISLSATLAFLLAAGTASAALNVTATASDLFPLPGELVTIDIYVETTAPEAIALGLRVANYDPAQFTNMTVTIAPSVIFDFGPGSGFGGLSNAATPGEEAPGGPRPDWSVNLFQGVSLAPAASAGPAHFQVQFLAGFVGFAVLDIGALAEYGDVYGGGDGIANNAVLVFGMPEPGTATLLGLGLLGLANTRRGF